MGWVTITFIAGVVAVLGAALAIDTWDKHNGRDPRRRGEILRSRIDQRHSRRIDMRSRRIGAGSALEDQFRAPPDDHDIVPPRRRRE
jgi:hypothetical protein